MGDCDVDSPPQKAVSERITGRHLILITNFDPGAPPTGIRVSPLHDDDTGSLALARRGNRVNIIPPDVASRHFYLTSLPPSSLFLVTPFSIPLDRIPVSELGSL